MATPNMKFGPYDVLQQIGAGGMGEVHRARDPRLGRDVAIKVLPPSFSTDPDRLRRFEQEARAAAGLNHPNILAIYDIGTQDGSPYIVSELLEGESLRDRLRGGPLPLRKAIDYALQAARGLAAAHDKGIVHRDLKPDNIFLTRDGRVKILDFGLAKLMEPGPADAARTNAPTLDVHTTPGMVLGTVGYMSPEQVRGTATDHRSDIFSFGAILHEMISGKRTFHGDTNADTMSAILREDPPDLSETNRAVPPAVERIVRHCLEKSPDERFQSARDIAFDLDALSGVSTTAAVAATTNAPLVLTRRWLLPALLALAVVAVVVVAYNLGQRGTVTSPPRYHQLTFRRGSIGDARFAPDGQTVIYTAAWEGKPPELFSSRTDSPGERQLGLTDARLLAISSAGEIAVLLQPRGRGGFISLGTLARMPLGGGAPREVLQHVQDADWSPDGKELAVIHFLPETGVWQVEYPIGKVLYESRGWISHVRISPQGQRIALLDHPTPGGDDRGSVVMVDLAGNAKTLSAGWSSEQGLVWSPSGKEIWFTASDTGNSHGLYAVSLSGKVRGVARVPGSLVVQDVDRQGRILVRHDNFRRQMMGRAPGESQERELTLLDWPLLRDISRDGKKILFEEEGEGGGPNYTVYVRGTDGSPGVRLGEGTALALSPDGAWVLTTPPGNKSAQFVLLPTGPGEPRQLTHDQLEHLAGRFFPDGKHILCICREAGHLARDYIVDVQSGEARALTPLGTTGSAISPDGNWVLVNGAEGKQLLWPAAGGDPRPAPDLGPSGRAFAWTGDGKGLYFSTVKPEDLYPRKIYLVDLATGKTQPWGSIAPPDRTGVGAAGPIPLIADDGKSYAYAFSRLLSELYVAEGLK